jgi:hypothetical protein
MEKAVKTTGLSVWIFINHSCPLVGRRQIDHHGVVALHKPRAQHIPTSRYDRHQAPDSFLFTNHSMLVYEPPHFFPEEEQIFLHV